MTPDSPYFRQVRLLVRSLPHVAAERCFALKGGTAINLFVRELPRLSVDIDLAYLPVADRDTSLAGIGAALERIRERLRTALPGVQVQATPPAGERHLNKMVVRHDGAQIKIEVTPALRGTVFAAEQRDVVAAVEAEFGYARMQLVSFADLYAGKLVAALDRQHPRDLFDVRLLLESEGLTRPLVQAFLVYLVSHGRPMSELLQPARKALEPDFVRDFSGMTREPVAIEALAATRERLIGEIAQSLTTDDRAFLLSVKRLAPQWELLGIPGVENLPAVRWKLENLARMTAEKRAQALQRLQAVLA